MTSTGSNASDPDEVPSGTPSRGRVPDEALCRAIRKAAPIRLAILFGSAARGRLRRDSDLDVAVASDRPLTPAEKLAIIESVAVLVGRPVDLVDLRAAGHAIRYEALAHGALLFCDDRTTLAEIAHRTVLDAEDFGPYLRRMLAERRRAWIGT